MTGIDTAPPPALIAPAPAQPGRMGPLIPELAAPQRMRPSLAAAPDASAERPPPPRPGMQVIFEDEFTRAPDEPGSAWMTSYFWGGRTLPTNKEEQFYVERTYRPPSGKPMPVTAFEARDGMLAVRAERIPEDRRSDFGGYAYSSGLLTTWKSYAFTYGYVEVRAKFPKGKGLWPAVWLLRRDSGKNGEIDIVELIGNKSTVMNSTLHYPEDGKQKTVKMVRREGPDLTGVFHVYAMDWTPEYIAMYLDGTEVGRVPTPEAFTKPMYLLINLAVGGNWPGAPDATTPFPAEMLIDYVRIWR